MIGQLTSRGVVLVTVKAGTGWAATGAAGTSVAALPESVKMMMDIAASAAIAKVVRTSEFRRA